jgi:PadR family transcriptional regulator PadR
LRHYTFLIYVYNFSKQLVAASSKPLLLGILQGGKTYGYEIIQKVKQLSGGQLEWSDGMLYPVLHRLEKDGLIISEWILSEEGRHRKYYALTEKGKMDLHREKSNWMAIHNVLLNL